LFLRTTPSMTDLDKDYELTRARTKFLAATHWLAIPYLTSPILLLFLVLNSCTLGQIIN